MKKVCRWFAALPFSSELGDFLFFFFFFFKGRVFGDINVVEVVKAFDSTNRISLDILKINDDFFFLNINYRFN